jgi:hypothetical protein
MFPLAEAGVGEDVKNIKYIGFLLGSLSQSTLAFESDWNHNFLT